MRDPNEIQQQLDTLTQQHQALLAQPVHVPGVRLSFSRSVRG